MVTNNELTGRFWPTPLQERLLAVALADPVTAAAAWQGLPTGFSLDELEPGSFELMPLVYLNLSASGSDDSRLPRLKGIYRRAWVRNNLLLERSASIARSLRAAGISPLLLEGAVLALRYYPDLGLRPSARTHVLIGAEDEAAALVQLGRDGWAERPNSGAYPGLRFLFDGSGNTCALRTSIAFDFVGGELSSGLPWDAAEWQEVAGTEVLIPCPTDALLSILVFGARLGPIPRTQWPVDAAMVLRAGDIDWDRLIAAGTARRQALRLREAFDYLHRLPIPHPPSGVRSRLECVSIDRRERLIYRLSAGSSPLPGALPEILAEHVVASDGKSLVRTLSSFPARLRARWGLAHSWQLPFAASGRAMRIGRKGSSG
jgi:Uncharacterised nucleotidyltransferase